MTLPIERAQELRFRACLRQECRLAGVTPDDLLSESRRAPLPDVRKRIVRRLRKVPPRRGQTSHSLFPLEWLGERLGRDHTTLMAGEEAVDQTTAKQADRTIEQLRRQGVSEELLRSMRVR